MKHYISDSCCIFMYISCYRLLCDIISNAVSLSVYVLDGILYIVNYSAFRVRDEENEQFCIAYSISYTHCQKQKKQKLFR
jgi:hypothetical protein